MDSCVCFWTRPSRRVVLSDSTLGTADGRFACIHHSAAEHRLARNGREPESALAPDRQETTS